MKAPFPWFGGKRRVAAEVWAGLGDVHHYCEPFAGSLAVLLERPPPTATRRRIETVNDADAHICNAWRAIQSDPDGVAAHADWPINETDLTARHRWLTETGAARLERLATDPGWFDVKVAGWWLWGISCWIGHGWCPTGRRPARNRPSLGAGMGVHSVERRADLAGVMNALAVRLRHVRVCAGDWTGVVTKGALAHGAEVGVFLDPPYSADVRDPDIYRVEDGTISTDVREWAITHGDDPRLRIVLAGYHAEHAPHMPADWRTLRWSATGGYAAAGHKNRHQETLWFSPHCQPPPAPQLFDPQDTTT